MKKTVLFFALLGLVCHAFAQNPNRVAIKGTVRDTSGVEMPFATVMLLSAKDSSLVNFARANEKGEFAFRSVKNSPYLLKISFTGYLPSQDKIGPFAKEDNDLGAVKIKQISKELIEVVIKAAKAPLSIRGDTIEYDATTFKVPPGSTVEDLLRRLPGIEVDAAGNIKAQGKSVKKVLVDGKTFFGEDPKAATKNLGAETISKVQVFNDKSEQSKLTGIDDGKKEKAINLELKDEFKKGSFGKLTGAVGTSDRVAARGNYNRFNKKEQFSIIGYGNNINETGVNWEDYGEFKGNNSWNYDNDDFGFGSNTRFYNIDDGNSETPLNSFDGRGFTNNAGAGVNYNYNHQKTKLSTNYFYNQTRLKFDQFSTTQTFQQNNSFYRDDTTNNTDYRNNHRMAFRLEQMIDSSNTIVSKTNVRFSNSNTSNITKQYLANNDRLRTSILGLDNGKLFNSYTLSSSAIYRHKFKKPKGQNFAISFGVNANGSDGSERNYSLTSFLKATTVEQQIRSFRNANENTSLQLKSSALFLKPFAKKWYWETFYNFSTTKRDVGRGTFNVLNNESRVDTLSTFFSNQIIYNRLGSSMRYSHDGINISAGLAAQELDLSGKFGIDKNNLTNNSISRSFLTWTPNLDATIEFKNNMYLNMGYNYGVREPSLNDLQPITNVNNPFYIATGNPNLLPERNHGFNFSVNKFDPATFASFYVATYYTINENQIVYNQTITDKFVTITRPENLSGGKQFNTYLYVSYPIVKTKLTLNFNGGIDNSTSPTYINSIRNETQNKGYNMNLGFSLTPGTKLIFDLSGGFNVSNVEYSIASQQNQKILNQTISSSMKWNFAPKFFLETNLDYTAYQNDRFGFNQSIPIWNASVRKLFMKDNKFEMRLAAFDLLNKRVSIYQGGNQNTVYRNITPTLAQYFMLSFSYNMRGFQNKLKKDGFF